MRARVRRVRLRQDHGDEAGERVGALVLPGDARGTRAGGRARRGRPRKLGGGRMRGLGVPEPAHAVLQRGFHGRGGVFAGEHGVARGAHTRAHARYHPPAGVGGAGRPQHLFAVGRREAAHRVRQLVGAPSGEPRAGRADVELGRSGHRGAAALPAGREGAGRGRARGRASPVVAGRRGRRGGGHGGGAHRAALRRCDVSGAAVVGGARPGARAAGAPRAPARRARLVRQARGAARRRPRPARGRSGGARGRQRRGEVHPVPHHRGAASGKRGHDDDRR